MYISSCCNNYSIEF